VRAWALTDVRSGEVLAGEANLEEEVTVSEEAAAFAKNPAYSNALVARRGNDEASLWERVWYTAFSLWN
jgi:hypothetical protein